MCLFEWPEGDQTRSKHVVTMNYVNVRWLGLTVLKILIWGFIVSDYEVIGFRM
jgi:hypothetical protein